MKLLGVLEGILYVLGDEGATIEQLKNTLEIDDKTLKSLLLRLKNNYSDDERGLKLVYLAEHFKLTTKEEHKNYYEKLLLDIDQTNLSPAALETLAIIAYNEPITRVKVDQLRGVSTIFIIKKLLAKGLIKEAGKSQLPGHPILYRTTTEFLDYFGLKTLNDLPSIDFNEEESEESNLFTSNYKEEAENANN